MQDLEMYEHLVYSQAAVSLRTASRLTGPEWWRNFKGWDASPVSCAFVLQQLTYMWLRRSGEISAAGGWHIAGVRESDGTHDSRAWLRGESCGGKWDMLESISCRIMNYQSYKRFFLCTFSPLHGTAAPQLRFPNKSQRLTRTRLKLETWV